MLDDECLKSLYLNCGATIGYSEFERLYCAQYECSKLNDTVRVLNCIREIDTKLRDLIRHQMFLLFEQFSIVGDINITAIFADKEFNVYMASPREHTGKYRSVRIKCSFGSNSVLFSYRDAKEEYMDRVFKIINDNVMEVENV